MDITLRKFFPVALIALMVLWLGASFVSFANAEDVPPEEPVVVDTPPPEEAPPAEETQTLSEETTPEEPSPSEIDGEPGENGQDGDTEEEENDGEPGGPAVVETGDAVALTESETDTNLNDTTTPENEDATVTSTNDGEIEQTAGAGATTGSNTAVGQGGASVDTGDAIASANVINVLNTNVVNSFGLFQFLNLLFGGGIDLRGIDLSYFFGGGGNGNCSLMSCANGTLNVDNTNNATTTNSLLVEANTGGNSAISSGDGGAIVRTGDAYASGNLINVINTNFVNSNYLLIAANNFGDLLGDITLPNADFFAQLLAMRAGGASGDTDITNNNSASVSNSVTAGASTGDNAAETGNGTAIVETGNAVSSANTYNQVNTNMVGGTTFYMLINILGDWSGTVTGLPAGITWAHTPTGIALMAEGGNFSGIGGGNGGLTVTNNNTANLTNDVQVYALTGDNYAGSESGTAGVQTGDAYASANVVNLVNTNVIGQNWLFMIFNIFGNWDGNLSFGKPDLWIGGVAETGNPTEPGGLVTYRFTVANLGDADATNVWLDADFDDTYLFFETGAEKGGAKWKLGNIAKGETREFTYSARAGSPSSAQFPIPLAATVTSDETDENPDDNTEHLSIVISTASQGMAGYAGRGAFTPDPKIKITKTANVSTTTIPATVDYTVILKNSGGAAYDTVLTDSLLDPEGELVYERSWELYTVQAGEEIKLTYSIVFDEGTIPGLYKNTVLLDGMKNNTKSAYAQGMKEVSATHLLELKKGEGKVLGAAITKPVCGEYITGYIRPNAKNNADQVLRLEYFLRDYEGEKITPDGVYDAQTVAAVKRFQEKHSENILGPWGIGSATGNVYYTTKKTINEVRCDNIARTQFPLSEKQENEILSFRSGFFGANFAKKPAAPKTEEVTASVEAPQESVAEAVPQEPKPDVVERTPESTPTAQSAPQNIFESFIGIFKWSQALLTVPSAEAYAR